MAAARFLDPASVPLRRHGGGNIWATLATATQVIIGVVAFSGLLLFFVPVINKTQQYEADQAELRANIDKALADQQEIKLETEHMKTDPAYVEHIARDQLQMGKPGEYIVSFPPYQALPLGRKIVHPRPQNDDPDGEN